MKIRRKVTLKSKTLNGQEIVHILQEFGKQTRNWSRQRKRSLEYSEDVGYSCMLFYNDGQFSSIFAFKENDLGQCHLVNIIPKNTSEISLPCYNSLLENFSVSFNRFIKNNKLSLRTSLSKDHAELLDIIPGKVVRRYLERYLKLNPPTSYHPHDIETLDLFICVASKYLREQINIPNLQRYLIEDLHWSGKDAEWCCDRIQTGLDILKVYKKS